MTVPLSGYRIRAGHHAAVDLTETYAIESLPRQSDQTPGRDWLRPDNEADVVEEGAETMVSLDGYASDYGRPFLRWKLRALTPLMAKYIKDTLFSGARSMAATIRTFNRNTGAWEVYQCVATRGRVSEEAEPALGGYDNLEIKFTDCVAV